jgi:hypothetical protein
MYECNEKYIVEEGERVYLCDEANCTNQRQEGLLCHTHTKRVIVSGFSKYAQINKPPYETNERRNWDDTSSRRNLIKYLCKNIDFTLTCVYNDLQDEQIAYKQQAFFLGLIILTGIRPGAIRKTQNHGSLQIRKQDMCLTDSITGQKMLNLTFYTKGQQLFKKSLELHDPILITSFEAIKNSNKTVCAFFNDVRYKKVVAYLKSILPGIRLKDLRTFKGSYGAFCVLELWRKFIEETKTKENENDKGKLEKFTQKIRAQPVKFAPMLLRRLLKNVIEDLGHDNFKTTLGYIDPDITFLILNELIDREKCTAIMSGILPPGIMLNWCNEDLTKEKCEKCIEFYRTPILLKVYFNNININEIQTVFDELPTLDVNQANNVNTIGQMQQQPLEITSSSSQSNSKQALSNSNSLISSLKRENSHYSEHTDTSSCDDENTNSDDDEYSNSDDDDSTRTSSLSGKSSDTEGENNERKTRESSNKLTNVFNDSDTNVLQPKILTQNAFINQSGQKVGFFMVVNSIIRIFIINLTIIILDSNAKYHSVHK